MPRSFGFVIVAVIEESSLINDTAGGWYGSVWAFATAGTARGAIKATATTTDLMSD
ncbi:hypothetical protein [Rhodococcus qingshengii]|uniref:hypothetical protein n=1 Tax=Rhodococcus qingshengii TaxID=334542 RepID=UPI0021B0DB1A|nr:hypothetical protein [Rhodococcus qingshengii]MCT6732416.1 hypothetical protein [Rhodococcus qingshengii]MDJ0432397.1 hypothetical protein [Rhodococcus qingshengii]